SVEGVIPLSIEGLQVYLVGTPVYFFDIVIMAEGKSLEGENLDFFLIPGASSYQINYHLELTLTEHLHPDHQDLAARIELDDWKGRHRTDSYITTLVGGGAKARAEVVLGTLGFISAIDTKQETNTFLQAVEQFSSQLPQEEEPQYRKRVYD